MSLMTSQEQLRRRLLGDPPKRDLLGWLGPLLAMVAGGIMRFWDLGRPHQLVFDETYYVKQAWSMLQFGVELRNGGPYGEKPDEAFTHGTLDVFNTTDGDLVVHGPVGKWVIAAGEAMFGGDSSIGWRFSVCVLGTISIFMLGRIARRLLGSSVLGTIAAVLLAFEGHHFVHSRTGLLDLILMFFALSAFGALLLDRDRSRGLLARRMAAAPPDRLTDDRWLGPALGWRPWRWVAAVSLGLAAGTKWSGLYFLVVFGLLTVLWDLGARRAVGIRPYGLATVLRDGIPAFVSVVPTVAVIYLSTWWGWFVSDHGYNKGWDASHPASATWAWLPGDLRSWWNYQAQILEFHRGLSTPHSYQSSPWSWLVMGRPTSMFAEYPKLGEDGCTVDRCGKGITPLGTPTIWWLGVAAVVVVLFQWALRRDWRAGAILAGYAGGYLPWFLVGDRTIFQFYAVAFVPYVVLAVTYLLGMIGGRPRSSPRRRQIGNAVVGGFLVVTVLVFAWFWPLYTAQVIPYSQWWIHMWFPSWV